MFSFHQGDYWELEVAMYYDGIPEVVSGKKVQGVVTRKEIDKVHVTLMKIAPPAGVVINLDIHEFFSLGLFVGGHLEPVGFAVRNRETGKYYIYE